MRMTRREWARWLAVATLGLALSTGPTPASAQSEAVVVFAAASLKNALDEIEAACSEATGKRAVISYAASSALARQIEEGAPADIFISADLDWMDYLAERDLIQADTRSNLVGNRIVLIAPKDSDVALDIAPGFDLAGALGEGRLAMANTDSVPAGKYGKAALQALGAWDAVADRVAQAENVRAALMLVARGEAPLGIVYGTDATSDPNVRVLGVFPEDAHPPIVYPVALTADAKPDARALLACIRSDAAKSSFETHGFTVLDRPAS